MGLPVHDTVLAGSSLDPTSLSPRPLGTGSLGAACPRTAGSHGHSQHAIHTARSKCGAVSVGTRVPANVDPPPQACCFAPALVRPAVASLPPQPLTVLHVNARPSPRGFPVCAGPGWHVASLTGPDSASFVSGSVPSPHPLASHCARSRVRGGDRAPDTPAPERTPFKGTESVQTAFELSHIVTAVMQTHIECQRWVLGSSCVPLQAH